MNRCNELLFSLKYAIRTFNFVPKCTQGLQGMGLNLFPTIKQFLFGCSLQKQFVGLNCFDLTKCCVAHKFYCSLVDRRANMSKETCRDYFIHSLMSHSSCIHFRACIKFSIMSCDMI